MNKLLFEPGSRYDIVIDFAQASGHRVILANYGGDSPYGGDIGALPIAASFDYTDRIMAFDVDASGTPEDQSLTIPNTEAFETKQFYPDVLLTDDAPTNHVRLVGLWEGLDEVSIST